MSKTNAEYLREHYSKNKTYYYDRNARRREECRAYVAESKRGKPCAKCGGLYPPYVLDYHHRCAEDKCAEISRLAHSGMIERVKDEIEKCDLVCANCHREIEFGSLPVRPMVGQGTLNP